MYNRYRKVKLSVPYGARETGPKRKKIRKRKEEKKKKKKWKNIKMDFGVLDWSKLDMPKDALGLAYENMTSVVQGVQIPPVLLLVLLLVIISVAFIIYKNYTEQSNSDIQEKNKK